MKNSMIGLDIKQSKKVAEKLNELLSTYQVFYQNLRGLHWNIKGEKFFELHAKFEELYTDANMKIDEIAERILTLGSVPIHTYSDYVAKSKLPERKNVEDGKGSVEVVLEGLKEVILLEREVLKAAEKLGDEGTLTLLTDYITQQEKEVWMYSSWMNRSV